MMTEIGYILLSVGLGFTVGALIMTILHFLSVLG